MQGGVRQLRDPGYPFAFLYLPLLPKPSAMAHFNSLVRGTSLVTRNSLTTGTHNGFRWRLTALLASMMAFMGVVSAQNVDVAATAGTANATYTTLKGAFDAINAGTHQGAITISVVANTTETATAALNNSGAGAAVYTSVAIAPSGGARIIEGSIAGAVVKLNGCLLYTSPSPRD